MRLVLFCHDLPLLLACVDQAPDLKDDIKTHFICFTQVGGELYELGRPSPPPLFPDAYRCRLPSPPYSFGAALRLSCFLDANLPSSVAFACVNVCRMPAVPNSQWLCHGPVCRVKSCGKAAGFGSKLSFEIP